MLKQISLQNTLFLDIETVPQYSNYSEVPENTKQHWAKKTESQRKNGETAEEFYSRAGIFAEFGKIVCISVGIFNKTNQLKIKSFYDHNEQELLQNFITLLNNKSSQLILCAHNGKEFDFPYICRRILINNLKIPKQLNISGKKPWEINHLDTLELWKFGDHKNYTSLDLLAAVFNIPTPKDDINGSDIKDVYWLNKDLVRISTYCQKDVITIARLIQKFKGLKTFNDNEIIIL